MSVLNEILDEIREVFDEDEDVIGLSRTIWQIFWLPETDSSIPNH